VGAAAVADAKWAADHGAHARDGRDRVASDGARSAVVFFVAIGHQGGFNFNNEHQP